MTGSFERKMGDAVFREVSKDGVELDRVRVLVCRKVCAPRGLTTPTVPRLAA